MPHSPLFGLDLQLSKGWRLITPPVYRYMEAKFVDAFFEDGSLRISSFSQFRKHKDEERGDTGEGSHFSVGLGPDSTIGVFGSVGSNCLVMSTATRLGTDLMSAFSVDAAIEIFAPTDFAHEVSRYLPGFVGGLEGRCIYQPDRMIRRDIQFDREVFLEKNKDGVDIQEFFDASKNISGDLPFLLKENSYSHQSEYRFVWGLRGAAPAYLDIKCPAAREFCRKVPPEDIAELDSFPGSPTAS